MSPQHLKALNARDAASDVYLKTDPENFAESTRRANEFIDKLSLLIGKKPQLIILEPTPYRIDSKPSEESLNKIGKSKDNNLIDIEFIPTYISPNKTPKRLCISLNETDYFKMKNHDSEIRTRQQQNFIKT